MTDAPAAASPIDPSSAPPAVGDPAPDVTLIATPGGEPLTLSDLWADGPVALYFYPKDATPGCTTEACDFRDRHDALVTAGAAAVGVSPDPPASHEKFIAKQSLPFRLLTMKSTSRRWPTACGSRNRCTAANTWACSGRRF